MKFRGRSPVRLQPACGWTFLPVFSITLYVMLAALWFLTFPGLTPPSVEAAAPPCVHLVGSLVRIVPSDYDSWQMTVGRRAWLNSVEDGFDLAEFVPTGFYTLPGAVAFTLSHSFWLSETVAGYDPLVVDLCRPATDVAVAPVAVYQAVPGFDMTVLVAQVIVFLGLALFFNWVKFELRWLTLWVIIAIVISPWLGTTPAWFLLISILIVVTPFRVMRSLQEMVK
jgi:hypothetical protein